MPSISRLLGYRILPFPQALSPQCTIKTLRGPYSHLIADFYRAFDDKHRGARELAPRLLTRFSAAHGEASGLFSTWTVAEESLFDKAGLLALWLGKSPL